MEEKKLIELFFRDKYPEKRYVMSGHYEIEDVSGEYREKTLVVEFFDCQLEERGKMEIVVKMKDLIMFAEKLNL